MRSVSRGNGYSPMPLTQQQVSRNKRQSCSPVKPKYYLPPMSGDYHYTLVLDLDETLVHFEAAERKFKIRPNCFSFLRELGQKGMFEIVIFTAAS